MRRSKTPPPQARPEGRRTRRRSAIESPGPAARRQRPIAPRRPYPGSFRGPQDAHPWRVTASSSAISTDCSVEPDSRYFGRCRWRGLIASACGCNRPQRDDVERARAEAGDHQAGAGPPAPSSSSSTPTRSESTIAPSEAGHAPNRARSHLGEKRTSRRARTRFAKQKTRFIDDNKFPFSSYSQIPLSRVSGYLHTGRARALTLPGRAPHYRHRNGGARTTRTLRTTSEIDAEPITHRG